jgi:hypothetical protein
MVRVRPPNIMATQLRNRKSREGRARIWQGSGLGYFREWRVSELMLPTRQKGQRKTAQGVEEEPRGLLALQGAGLSPSYT